MRTNNHKNFNKLVRDKIPDIIKKTGKEPKFMRLAEGKRREALRNKLNEEVEELTTATAPEEILEEIADVYEVLVAMVYEAGYIDADLFLKAKQKKREKGAFDDFIWLENVE